MNEKDYLSVSIFAVIANDWGKTGEGLRGDISGPNGIPDGTVNWYDLSAFANDYLN